MDDMYPADPNAHLIEVAGHEDFIAVHRSSTGEVTLDVGNGGPVVKLSSLEARDLGAHLISASTQHQTDERGFAPKPWNDHTMPTARLFLSWLSRCTPAAQETVLGNLLLHSHEGRLCWEASHSELIQAQDKRYNYFMGAFNELACQLLRSGNHAGYKVKHILEGHLKNEQRATGTDSQGEAG